MKGKVLSFINEILIKIDCIKYGSVCLRIKYLDIVGDKI